MKEGFIGMSENEKLEQTKAEKPQSAEKAEKKDKSDRPSFPQRVKKWFKEMKSELKKVQWPSVKTVRQNTLTVIGCVLVVGVFIWLFDLLANSVVGALLNLFAG